MIRKTLLSVIAVAAVAAAAPARAQSFSVEGFGGWQNLRLSADSFENAVEGDEGTGIVGGQVLLGLGFLGIGAVVDKAVGGDVEPWSGALMAGVLVPVRVVRLELLGEVGRRALDFGDIFSDDGRTFVGFRPGLSFRLAPSPIIIGVSGIVRWPTRDGDFGSPDYGIVGRIGLGMF